VVSACFHQEKFAHVAIKRKIFFAVIAPSIAAIGLIYYFAQTSDFPFHCDAGSVQCSLMSPMGFGLAFWTVVILTLFGFGLAIPVCCAQPEARSPWVNAHDGMQGDENFDGPPDGPYGQAGQGQLGQQLMPGQQQGYPSSNAWAAGPWKGPHDQPESQMPDYIGQPGDWNPPAGGAQMNQVGPSGFSQPPAFGQHQGGMDQGGFIQGGQSGNFGLGPASGQTVPTFGQPSPGFGQVNQSAQNRQFAWPGAGAGGYQALPAPKPPAPWGMVPMSASALSIAPPSSQGTQKEKVDYITTRVGDKDEAGRQRGYYYKEGGDMELPAWGVCSLDQPKSQPAIGYYSRDPEAAP
jgi:hypothetical protein